MRVPVLREHGAIGLSLETGFPDPVPGDGNVVLRACRSLNYYDIFTRRGMLGIRIPMPATMRRISAVLLVLAVLPGLVASALAQTIGIVLMHGKTGSPSTVIVRLAIALQSAGYLVDTPEMCWSRRRIWGRRMPPATRCSPGCRS